VKKTIILMIMLCLFSSLAFAQQSAGNLQIKGVIIDNSSVDSLKLEKVAELVKVYTKETALKPQSVASGYSIFFKGQLMKFDKISNLDIESFLKVSNSKLQVVVECAKVGDLLRLVYIENQK
jgi:hypothetical protein